MTSEKKPPFGRDVRGIKGIRRVLRLVRRRERWREKHPKLPTARKTYEDAYGEMKARLDREGRGEGVTKFEHRQLSYLWRSMSEADQRVLKQRGESPRHVFTQEGQGPDGRH